MTDAKNFKIIFYDKDDCEHLVKYGAATSREFIEECIEMFKKKYDHFKSAVVIFNGEIIEYKLEEKLKIC